MLGTKFDSYTELYSRLKSHNVIYTLLLSIRKDKSFCTISQQAFPKFNLILNFYRMGIWFVDVQRMCHLMSFYHHIVIHSGGAGTMLQTGRSRVRYPMRWFLNLPNPSSRTRPWALLRYSLFLFLKYLLVSRLTLFRLSPFISLGSCNHCNLASFLWCNNFEHPSSNHSLCFSIRNTLDSLRLHFLYSL
jgi:hypothetical protein